MKQIFTVKDVLRESVEIYGPRNAFALKNGEKEEYITYKQFGEDVEALSFAFSEKLKLKGSHIGILAKNSYQWCLSYFSILSGGGVAVPLDRDNDPEENAGLVAFGDVNALICDLQSAYIMKKLLNEDVLIITTQESEEFISIDSLIIYGQQNIKRNITERITDSREKMAVLLFTSGTTGAAKGVMLSHHNLISDLKAVSNNISLSYEDRALSVLPLHHTYEAMALLTVIHYGGTVCFADGYRNLSKDFLFYKPTVLVCVPLLLEKLHRRIEKEMELQRKKGRVGLLSVMSGAINRETKRKIFSSVHDGFGGKLAKIIVGAAPLKKKVAEAFENYGFSVIIGYGLTECSPIVICNSELDRKTDSIGKPLTGVDVKIIDTDEKGRGEILVSGPMVMLGYYKAPEETARVIKNGWLKTGDLGYKDSDGYYYITGRKKNVIVTNGGKNIYPEELEYYLSDSPLVAECIISSDDGRLIKAEIFPDMNELIKKSKKENLTYEEKKLYIGAVIKRINKKLPPYKRIGEFVLREKEFEKTSTRKIKR